MHQIWYDGIGESSRPSKYNGSEQIWNNIAQVKIKSTQKWWQIDRKIDKNFSNQKEKNVWKNAILYFDLLNI